MCGCHYIFGLEQLGDAKKSCSSLVGSEVGPLIDEVENLCKDDGTFPDIDVVIVECPCLQYNISFLQLVTGQWPKLKTQK